MNKSIEIAALNSTLQHKFSTWFYSLPSMESRGETIESNFMLSNLHFFKKSDWVTYSILNSSYVTKSGWVIGTKMNSTGSQSSLKVIISLMTEFIEKINSAFVYTNESIYYFNEYCISDNNNILLSIMTKADSLKNSNFNSNPNENDCLSIRQSDMKLLVSSKLFDDGKHKKILPLITKIIIPFYISIGVKIEIVKPYEFNKNIMNYNEFLAERKKENGNNVVIGNEDEFKTQLRNSFFSNYGEEKENLTI